MLNLFACYISSLSTGPPCTALTLIQPIRHAVEHGGRTRVRDPEYPAVPVAVNLVIQIVLVHKHEAAAHRRPLRPLDVHLLAILRGRLRCGRERHSVPAWNKNGQIRTQLGGKHVPHDLLGRYFEHVVPGLSRVCVNLQNKGK